MKKSTFGTRSGPPEHTTAEVNKLSRREIEVLYLSAEGNSLKMISESLNIALATVDTHSRAVVKKLEAKNMKHAIAIGMRKKIIK